MANDEKPAKGAPVIRTTEVATEDVGSRVLNRHLPAWVISGAIHVVLIGFFVIFFSGGDVGAKPQPDLTTTQVDPPKEEDPNLLNEDVGLDPNLEKAIDVPREENVNVDAKVTEDAVGIPDQEAATAPDTAVAGINPDLTGGGANAEMGPDGAVAAGAGGGKGALSLNGMNGRSGSTRNAMLAAGGGNTASEAAVASGLAWLARMQKKDGSWEFDGSRTDGAGKMAAVGMGLLPFLAAGETHKTGTKYKDTVAKGLKWLMDRVGSGGQLAGTTNMYAIGIVGVALCEAAGMTGDPAVKGKATLVVSYIVNAQATNGSWGYDGPKTINGDTSIVGWQIQALASARMAGIKFDKDKVYKDTVKFLDSVSSDSGALFGYRDRTPTQSLTPVGVLSKYYMMEMNPKHPSYTRAVDYIKKVQPRKDFFDMYYYYYATQVMHFYEGPDWHKLWNPKMRDMLIEMQRKGGDDVRGSWDRDIGHIGSSCGRLGTTVMALLTLEVYYRHLPLYKRDGGGLAELERNGG